MQLLFRPELDSELLDDRTKVLGVLAADNDGMCLMGKYCNVPEEIFQYYIFSFNKTTHKAAIQSLLILY